MSEKHENYMLRCLQLAQLGEGSVAPNPMVGAVLVYNDIIIGEGYHQHYGQAHAEVNCLASVEAHNTPFIRQSTLYVSLEPCAHFGKTPPCTDLIIQHQIPRVVIGCLDSFKEVSGRGIAKLQQAGIEVVFPILESPCLEMNKRFFTFHQLRRSYVVLKWAQSINGKIACSTNERIYITNEFTNSLVHRWRTQEAAILVGTNTVTHDNPQLDNRLWMGNSPIRLVLDKQLKLLDSKHIFNGKHRTIIFNNLKNEKKSNVEYHLLSDFSINSLLSACYQLGILSVLVEGGRQLLQSFIDEDLWDETRVIINQQLHIPNGIPAPDLKKAKLAKRESLYSDHIYYYLNS